MTRAPPPSAALALALALGLSLAGPASAGEKKAEGGGGSYVRLPAITATLARAGGGHGVLTAEAGVDTPDPLLRAKVDRLLPRLRDAYNAVLADFTASLAPGALPDLELLVRRLQSATDRVVGRSGVRVLIGSVVAE